MSHTPSLPKELAHIPAELWAHAPGTWAGFVPSEGFNCVAFRVLVDGVWQPILSEPPNWDAIRNRPSWYGAPILAPWVFGMAGDEMPFRGKRYPIAPGKEGHANHGFSRDLGWTVDDIKQRDHDAVIRGSLAMDDPARFPWPVRLRVEYRVSVSSLTTTLGIDNLSPEAIPVGAGLHPYVDLAPRSGRPNDALTVCATMRRLTDREPELVGDWGYSGAITGDQFAMNVGDVIPWLADGVRMGDLFRRGALPGDATGNTPLTWEIEDATRGLTVSFHVDASLPYISQFVPPDRSVLSPVFASMRHGGHQRAEDGLESGLVVLEPGQSWRSEIVMRIR